MYFRSRFEGVPPCGTSTSSSAGLTEARRTDRHFVEPGAGVFADDAVDLEMLLAAVLLEGRQDAADGLPLALHFQHIAHVDAQPLHVGRIDPCNPPADVLAGRLADPEA